MLSLLDKRIAQLNEELTVMGSMCENAIALSAKAFLEGDIPLAKQVPELAVQIDQKERDIQDMCLKLLLQQQPVARDLRAVSAALKMVTDMERIGHQSADIAEIVISADLAATADALHIHDMAEAVIGMVTNSIHAFVKKDMVGARAVITYDDVVDEHFVRIKQGIIAYLSEPDTDGEYAVDLLMIAKYFERIGDHAVNIAHWVLFSLLGFHNSD